MVLLIFILILFLIIFNFRIKTENFKNNIQDFFPKDDLKLFQKYSKYSQTFKIPQGQVTICDSKIIEELPQVTWNGYYINNLLIYPKYRKKGYGKFLIEKIISKAKKEGKLHLISQVEEKNKPATFLHKKLGFKQYFRGLNKKNEVVNILVYYL